MNDDAQYSKQPSTMINCYQYTAQGWKFFTKAKEWKSDPAISVTSEFSSLTKVSPLRI